MGSGVELVPNWSYVIAIAWGVFIAVFMRYTTVGRFLARHAMWFIVACGAGIDLWIVRQWYMDAAGMVPWEQTLVIFFWTAIPIALWSLTDLAFYLEGMIRGYRGE